VSRAAREHGFTVIEMTVAMTIMIVVLLATLMTLDVFTSNTRRNGDLTDAVDRVRTGMDGLARELRNATAYQTTSNSASSSLLRAGQFDLVFKTVDPRSASTSGNPYAVQSIRYCLDPATGILYRQTHTDAALSSTSCPDTTWTTSPVMVGLHNGASRPAFTYDAASTSDVAAVRVDLFVTVPGRASRETELTSGIFVRNQNRAPTAAFTASPGPNLHVQLNGSASLDPDGGLLSYTWSDGSTQLPQTGAVVDYVAPGSGSHTFTLTVTDNGGLTSTTTQTVTVQS
jgi:type II secretory pathway component PulJ